MLNKLWLHLSSHRKKHPDQSVRQMSRQTGMPKSSVYYHLHIEDQRHQFPESEFWDTEAGQNFLRRLITSTIYTFGMNGLRMEKSSRLRSVEAYQHSTEFLNFEEIKNSFMAIEIGRRLLTVEEYHQMAEAGILKEEGLELINGEIIKMSPVGSRHASLVEKLKDLLTVGLYQKAIVRVQNPVCLSEYSEPEPDLAIVKYRKDYYEQAHPKPVDVLVLIEVAVSSVEYDEDVKLPLYATSQIPEFWLVNVEKRQIEVHTDPAEDDYKIRKIFKVDDVLAITGFDLKIPVNELFY